MHEPASTSTAWFLEKSVELQGEQVIGATRARVWAALNDPTVLMQCIPGCEALDRISETESHARMLAKVGPVRARFNGRILMSDIVAPEGCTLSFEGSGGTAGIAKGSSTIKLLEHGELTRLVYSVQASVGGKLGQIGGRLIDASAKKMADDFFRAFNEKLSPSAAPGHFTAAAAPTAPSVPGVASTAGPLAEERSIDRSHGTATALLGVMFSDIQRLIWLAVGLGLGGLIGHLWRT